MHKEKINWGFISVFAAVVFALIFLLRKNNQTVVQQQGDDWQPSQFVPVNSPTVSPIPLFQFVGDPNATQQSPSDTVGSQTSTPGSCSTNCGGCDKKKHCYASDDRQLVTSKAIQIQQMISRPAVVAAMVQNIQSAIMNPVVQTFSQPVSGEIAPHDMTSNNSSFGFSGNNTVPPDSIPSTPISVPSASPVFHMGSNY